MSSKESIIEKLRDEVPFFMNPRLKPYISEALDIWAKEMAIKFKEWQDENTEGKIWENYDGHDTWYNGFTKEVIETGELFNRFLKQTEK